MPDPVWQSTNELAPDISGVRNATGREYTRTFRVDFDIPHATLPARAEAATGIPAYNDAYPYARTGIVTPRVTEIKTSLFDKNLRTSILVEVKYSNNQADLSAAAETVEAETTLPWARDALFSYGYIEKTRAALWSKGDTPAPIVNSVGDLFDPQPEEPYVHRKITATFATTAFDPSEAAAMWGTINEAGGTINGETFQELQCKLLSWTAEEAVWTDPTTQVETTYYNNTIEIEVQPESAGGGFLLKILNRGYRANDGSGNIVRVTDASGRPVSTPVILNPNGTVADPDTITEGDAVLQFQVCAANDWADMPAAVWTPEAP